MRTANVDIDDGIDRLLIVSDLHGYLGPLDMIDRAVADADGSVRIIASGDYFAGGCHPVETLDWVRSRAGECAVLGNHDELVQAGAEGDHPLYSEAGAFVQLDESQIEYLRNLPHALELRWRGFRIRILHGHRTLDEQGVPWTAKPRELLEHFGDASVDLTVLGHTHYPFVHHEDGLGVANSGSVSMVIFGSKQADGMIVPQGDEPVFKSESGIYSTFMWIAVEKGELLATIELFDYDREQALQDSRAAGDPNLQLRQVWLETGLCCF